MNYNHQMDNVCVTITDNGLQITPVDPELIREIVNSVINQQPGK